MKFRTLGNSGLLVSEIGLGTDNFGYRQDIDVPAIVNAALDALAPLGIQTIDMPLKPEKVWALIQSAPQGTLEQTEPIFPEFFTSFNP